MSHAPVMSKVYVTNIAPAVQANHLKELFACCGPIKACEITKIDNSDDRVCVVEFEDPKHAKASQFLTGTPLGDRNLKVSLSAPAPTPSALLVPAHAGVSVPLLPITPTSIPLLLPAFPSAMNSSAGSSGFSGALAGPTAPTSSAALSAAATFVTPALAMAHAKRADDVARTVYVGNLGPMVDEPMMNQFFSVCGEVTYVKLAGDSVAGVRYAFVEFKDQISAAAAMALSGSMLGDRAVKVGKANNPIVKNNPSPPVAADPDKVSAAMKRVKEAQEKLSKKLTDPSYQEQTEPSQDHSAVRSGSRSRSRSPRRKSRSRSRSRRRRSSRSGRTGSSEGHRRRDRSRRDRRSRSRSPQRRRSPVRPPRIKKGPDRTGQFWDGFQWHEIPKAANNTAATVPPGRM